MRVSVSDLLQSIPLPITLREVNIHAAVMLLTLGDVPAFSFDAKGNCWITLLCCSRQGWESKIILLDGPAQREGFYSRYDHLRKQLPLLPQNRIAPWLGENVPSDPGRWMQREACVVGGCGELTACLLKAGDLPIFLLRVQACLQSPNAGRGILEPVRCCCCPGTIEAMWGG